MKESSSTGVYFLANDKVYQWAVAFLNSFRSFNPTLRLILIPFNEQCDRLLQLKEQYDFEVYTDSSFPRLEAIGQAFELGHTPTGPYWFRRYASFWGPLDRFMYLDARQLVLADLQPLIEALDRYGFDFLHYDCAINQVYEPGTFRQGLLKLGRGRGFLSGLWASRKDLFSIEEFEQLAAAALKVRDQLNPRNTDQAFINYCCDMKAVRYAHLAEVMGGICHSGWARQSGEIYQQNGKYYLWDYGGLDHKKQVVLLHWAGYRLNASLPRQGILNQFLFQKQSLLKLVSKQVSSWLLYGFVYPSKLLQENQTFNTLYHLIKN